MPTQLKILTRMTAIFLVLMANLAYFASPVQASDEPVVRITQVDTSQFPHVTVYVSVTDTNGEPIEIEASRLELSENGTAIKPESVTGVGEMESPLITMLVMDVSGSMDTADKLDSAKEAARAYVRQMRPNDKAGLMSFNTQIDLVRGVTGNSQKLLNGINNLKARDDTAMYDALMKAVDELEGYEGRKAIIVLTDGMDNRSQTDAAQVLAKIGPSGLSISTIGLGDPAHSSGTLTGLDEAALSALAQTAGGVYGYANDADSLLALYERYGRALQSEYAITYSSPSTLRDGVNRALTISLKGSSAVSATVEDSSYNPGGLVPEVAQPASWPLFLGLLIVLIALLFLPMIVGKVTAGREDKSSGRVKLKNEASTKRVKLKQ